MNLQTKGLKETEISHLSLFIVTAVVTFIVVLFCKEELLVHTKVLDINLLNLQMNERNNLFFYVLRERCLVIPLLFLLSTTYLTNIVGYVFVLWYGAGIGALLGVAILRYGIRGILLILAAGFPQFLLYIPVFLVTLKMNRAQRAPNNKFFMQLFLLESIVLIGCMLESYVNPILVKKIIHLFMGG